MRGAWYPPSPSSVAGCGSVPDPLHRSAAAAAAAAAAALLAAAMALAALAGDPAVLVDMDRHEPSAPVAELRVGDGTAD